MSSRDCRSVVGSHHQTYFQVLESVFRQPPLEPKESQHTSDTEVLVDDRTKSKHSTLNTAGCRCNVTRNQIHINITISNSTFNETSKKRISLIGFFGKRLVYIKNMFHTIQNKYIFLNELNVSSKSRVCHQNPGYHR